MSKAGSKNVTCKPTQPMESANAVFPLAWRWGLRVPSPYPGRWGVCVRDGPGSPWCGTSVERKGSCRGPHPCEVRSLGPGALAMPHLSAAQNLCLVQPVSRKVYFSVRDSCKTCWSSSSSSRSRSSRSSSSLAESSMASCKSLSKRLVSLEAPGPRPSELVRRLSWMALCGEKRQKEETDDQHHQGGGSIYI